ncbi:MAG: VOC family protein, partial [Ignavibacteria bacterium]
MKTTNPVVHFEMPAEDRKRMSDFYSRAFGWQTKQLGPEMGNYVIVTTSDSDEKGPKKPGAINGGFFDKTKDNQHPSVVIAVDDIKEAMKKVEAAGGKILGGSYKAGEPDDIPG